ncbi:MAG TPA: DUF2087 domain-containing protein [Humibacter sp.]|nr:DUF2087 domain-containing protein [Humibacter sp.]
MTEGSNDWRPIVATLADDRVRTVYARLVLGDTVDEALEQVRASARSRVRERLIRSGLVALNSEGTIEATAEPFRALLAAQPANIARGVERFLRGGRIDRYPSNAAERHELLELIAHRAVGVEEALTEAQINERLGAYADDVALLRRRLVDGGIVQRTRSGSSYALAG